MESLYSRMNKNYASQESEPPETLSKLMTSAPLARGTSYFACLTSGWLVPRLPYDTLGIAENTYRKIKEGGLSQWQKFGSRTNGKRK